MHYRKLTIDELNELKDDFVRFLAANGIDSNTWLKLKKEDKEKADHLISLFSDMVFESIFKKVLFIKQYFDCAIYTYQCLKDKIVLVALEFSDDMGDIQNFEDIPSDTLAGCRVFTTSKKYQINRELELYEMVEKGCEICDGSLFKKLSLLL